MNIKFNDLTKQWEEIKEDFMKEFDSFMNSSAYIGGSYLEKFERDFSLWTSQDYAIGVSNGTDGLKLAIQAFNFYEGKTNVVMPANTYIADPLSVSYQVKGDFDITLIDHDDYYQMDLDLLSNHLHNNRNNYDNCILMPVHLYGHPTDMEKVSQLANQYNCKIIEDASQAHGSATRGQMVGFYADMTVYSLYPGKNLGAIGDAGIITTNNKEYKDRLVSYRNYGSSKKYYYDDIGWNNRMDPLQALFLSEKLKHLQKWNRLKKYVAEKYDNFLDGIVDTPKVDDHVLVHSYHIYCVKVEKRELLQKFLETRGIPTVIHYPVPIQKTTPFLHLDSQHNPKTVQNADKILSLPMHPWLTDSEIEYICSSIKEFYESN